MLAPPRTRNTEQPDSRICCGCGQLLSLQAFRLRSAASPLRQSRCRPCYNAYMRGYRAAKRAGQMDEFAAQVRRQRTTAGVLGTTARLVQSLGSPGALTQAFTAHVHSLPPGSARAASFRNAILRLVAVCPSPQLDQLGDESLDAAIRHGHVAP